MRDIPEFQVGQTVYHRSCGTRVIVVGIIDYGDCYRYMTAGPFERGNMECHPREISDEKNYNHSE